MKADILIYCLMIPWSEAQMFSVNSNINYNGLALPIYLGRTLLETLDLVVLEVVVIF